MENILSGNPLLNLAGQQPPPQIQNTFSVKRRYILKNIQQHKLFNVLCLFFIVALKFSTHWVSLKLFTRKPKSFCSSENKAGQGYLQAKQYLLNGSFWNVTSSYSRLFCEWIKWVKITSSFMCNNVRLQPICLDISCVVTNYSLGKN